MYVVGGRAGSCLATRPHVQAEKAVLAEWNHVSPLSVTMASQESPETRSSLVTSWTCASFEDVIIQFDDILCALPTSGIDVLNENLQTSTISQIMCYDI